MIWNSSGINTGYLNVASTLLNPMYLTHFQTPETKWLVFLAVLVIGVFTISCGTVSYELSAETTYPEPEEVSSGLLSVAQQVYGTILVLIVGSLLRTYGDKVAHSFLAIILTLGLLLAILTKNDLKRQNAREEIIRNAYPLLRAAELNKV